MNLGSSESCRRFPLSPFPQSREERAGVMGPPLPWGSGAQSASNRRGVFLTYSPVLSFPFAAERAVGLLAQAGAAGSSCRQRNGTL
jgi:hypothetical protein